MVLKQLPHGMKQGQGSLTQYGTSQPTERTMASSVEKKEERCRCVSYFTTVRVERNESSHRLTTQHTQRSMQPTSPPSLWTTYLRPPAP